MTDRQRLFVLVTFMTGVCLVSGGLAIFLLYDAVQNWGVSQHLDVAQMHASFARAIFLGALSAAIAISFSAYLFMHLTNPLLKRLQQSEAQIRAILETAVDGIITIDEHGVILTFNRAAETMFGYCAKSMIGGNVNMLMPEPFLSAHDDQTIGIGREVEGKHRDGTVFPMDLAISEAHRDGALSFTAIMRNITARKRAEQELRDTHGALETAHEKLRNEQAKHIQAEKLSSIGLLASGVAHEINNPLSGVMACVKSLRSGRLSKSRREEYFDTTKDGLERIQTIVRDLLDYGRQRPMTTLELDAAEFVDACLRLVAPVIRKREAVVVQQIAHGAIKLHGDRSQLMQALMNVLLNAVYVTPTGGTIKVTVLERANQVGLCVNDDGPGISEEHIARVRDPFFTTKGEGQGTGLGLSVTDGIIRAHGGELDIDCTEGLGTRVTLWLPKQRSAA